MSGDLAALVEDMVGRPRAALAVGVVAGNEDAVVGFGRARSDDTAVPDSGTIFEIGSITKVFTGILLARLALEGVVRLEDRVSSYLGPELAVPGDPTLLALATHGTGLPNVPKGFARREIAFALGLPRARDPHADVTPEAFAAALARTRARRRRFRYSSLGFGLLGGALERAAGATYEDLVRELVCVPLGMVDTAIDPIAPSRLAHGHSRRGRRRPPFRDHTLAAAGLLHSTAGDMIRFLRANLAPEETPIGPPLELAQKPHTAASRGLAVGLGWIIASRRGRTLHWHNGGTWGFRAFAAIDRGAQTGAVVFANRSRSQDRLGLRLMAALSAGRAL